MSPDVNDDQKFYSTIYQELTMTILTKAVNPFGVDACRHQYALQLPYIYAPPPCLLLETIELHKSQL
jgi:hypothetical protein